MIVFIAYPQRKKAVLCVRPVLEITKMGFSQDNDTTHPLLHTFMNYVFKLILNHINYD